MSAVRPILYSYFRSSASHRVRAALYLKGIEFEYRAIHLIKEGGDQNQKAYRDLNPKGEVPLLVWEGQKIAQSMAILDFLEHKQPNPSLIPHDAYRRAKCLEFCEIMNSGIQPLHNLKVVHKIQGDLGLSDEWKSSWISHWMREGFVALEALLKEFSGRYAFGDELTWADILLVAQLTSARRFGVSLEGFPLIQKIGQEASHLEAFKRAAPENQPDAT